MKSIQNLPLIYLVFRCCRGRSGTRKWRAPWLGPHIHIFSDRAEEGMVRLLHLGQLAFQKFTLITKLQRMKHEWVKAPTSCFARHLKILMFPRFLHRPTCEMRIAKGSPDITSVFSLCPVRVSCQPDKHSRASWQRSGFLLQIALKMLVAPLHESVNFGFRLFRLLRSFEGWIGFCQLPWVTRILQTRVLRAGASLSVTRCPASRCKKWRGIEG